MKYKRIYLEDVCDISMGQAPSGDSYNNDEIGMPLIAGAGDFTNGKASPSKFTTKPTKICEKNDIILGIRASIGEKIWADKTYCLGRGVTGIRANKLEVDPHFLWHWLSTQEKILLSKARGATFKQISKKDIHSLCIYLPPLDEQRRIAEKLDLACKMRSLAAIRKAKLKKLEASLFFKLFGDPLINTKGWNQKKLKEIAILKTGNTPSRVKENYFGNHIEWIKSDNLNNKGDYPSLAKEMLSKEGMKVARIAKKDSILVTCIAGSPNCIGNSCILDRAVAFNQQINSIELISEEPFFIYSQIKLYKNLIQNASNNSMKGMVNKSKFGEIKLIIPPIDIQRKFSKQALINKKILSRIDLMQNKVDEFNKSLQFKLINNI